MAPSYSKSSVFASLPKTERGVPLVINGDPKGKNFIYTNGNNIYIRDIQNPAIVDIYSEHQNPVSVAKYAPSGNYIASADITGKVRIWDTINAEHLCKYEHQPMSGQIKDLAWTFDNQRIAVCGNGREMFGRVFTWDGCNSVGEFIGQTKQLNSVDFRPCRPFRMVSASEDNSTAFFHGVPFKFQNCNRDHTRFAQTVCYSPNGEVFISGGSDGMLFVYDGKTGEKKSQLGQPAHAGGVYAISFSPDSKFLLSVSGDKTAKLWDIAAESVVNEYTMGTTIEDQQVGCLWQNEHLLTVSLSGYINYLDRNVTSRPIKIIMGHNKPITALTSGENKNTIYTASSRGRVCHWDCSSGVGEVFEGKGHGNQVQHMKTVGNTLITCGLDDTVMFSDLNTSPKQFGSSVSLPSQPKQLGVHENCDSLLVVACSNHIVVMRNKNIVFTLPVKYDPQCVSLHPNLTELAVGTSNKFIFIYTINGDSLEEKKKIEAFEETSDVSYSSDGNFLASADSTRKVLLFNTSVYEPIITNNWCAHTAKVKTLGWSDDSRLLASGSLDTNLIVWQHEKQSEYLQIKKAHMKSQINSLCWLNSNTLVSVGQDSNIKLWTISGI